MILIDEDYMDDLTADDFWDDESPAPPAPSTQGELMLHPNKNDLGYFVAGCLAAFLSQIFTYAFTGHFMSWLLLGIICVVVAFVVSFIDEAIKAVKEAKQKD